MNPVALFRRQLSQARKTPETPRVRHSLSGAHDENRKRQTAQFSGKETHRWMLVLTEVEWMITGSGGKKLVPLWA